MITINRLISEAQNEINDVSMTFIQPKEWVDILNDTAMDIAETTHMWIKRVQFAPNLAGDANVYEANLAASRGLFMIIKVIKNSTDGTWSEYGEYSKQAISNAIDGNASFGVNNTIIEKGYAVKHVNIDDEVDGSITLVFPQPFEISDELIVDYITDSPFADTPFVRWNASDTPQISVPNFLRDAFKWGLIWRAQTKMFNRGIQGMQERLTMSMAMYNGGPQSKFIGGYLRNAASYCRRLKSKGSTMAIQPLNYLPE